MVREKGFCWFRDAREEAQRCGVEVCALSALCALWVEVCALSALCVKVAPPHSCKDGPQGLKSLRESRKESADSPPRCSAERVALRGY